MITSATSGGTVVASPACSFSTLGDFAASSLKAAVTRAYSEVLRRKEAATLAAQQLERARVNLRLARGHELVDTPGEPVSQHRRHGGNTPSDWLYAGALRVADRQLAAGLAARPSHARGLLLERRVDSLWGLGDVRGARKAALSALRLEPSLLRHRRLRKRLLASLAPRTLLTALRRLR